MIKHTSLDEDIRPQNSDTVKHYDDYNAVIVMVIIGLFIVNIIKQNNGCPHCIFHIVPFLEVEFNCR